MVVKRSIDTLLSRRHTASGLGDYIEEEGNPKWIFLLKNASYMSPGGQCPQFTIKPLRSRLQIEECDIRDPDAVHTVILHTIERLGGLDGIVANAGFGTSGRVLRVQ